MREPFLVNPPRRHKRRRKVSTISYNLSRRRRRRRTNAAAVPVRRRVVRHRRRVRRNVWPERRTQTVSYRVAPRHRRAAIKGVRRRKRRNPPLMVAGYNPVHRRRRHYRRNVVRRYRRHYRRNPVTFGMRTITSNFPYFITGALSAIAVTATPAVLGPGLVTNPWIKYAAQGVTAIGGGMVVDMVVPGKKHGTVWMIVGGATIVADILKEYVLKGMLGLSGYELGEAGDYTISTMPEPPGEGIETMDAFPDTLSAFPDVALQY